MKSLLIILGLLLILSFVNAEMNVKKVLSKSNCKEEALRTCGTQDNKMCYKGIKSLCKIRTVFDACRIRSVKKCGAEENQAECRTRKTLKCREKSLGTNKVLHECERRAIAHCKIDTHCQESFINDCKEAKDAINVDKGESKLIEKVFVVNNKGQKVSRVEKLSHLATKPLWKHEVLRKANCVEKAQIQCNSDKSCEERMIRVCKRGAFFEGCREKALIKCGNQSHQKTCRVQATHKCRSIYLGKHNHHRECVLRSKRNCPLGDKKCRKSFVRSCRRSLDSANPINGEIDITIRTSYLVYNLERRDALRNLHPSRKNLNKWKRTILKKGKCRRLAQAQCKNGSAKCVRKFERGCKRRTIFHACKFNYANQICRMGLNKNSSKCRVKFARRCRNTLLGHRSVKKECKARSRKHCPNTDKLCNSTFVKKCRKALDAANPTVNGENDITILTK